MISNHHRVKLSKGCVALLVAGLIVQISGLIFNNDGSQYATQTHWLLFAPALCLLLNERFAYPLWHQSCSIALLTLLGFVALSGSIREDAMHSPGYWLKITLFILLYVFAVAHTSRLDRIERILLICSGIAACFAWLTLIHQFLILDKPLSYDAIRDGGRLFELGWNGFADLDHPIIAGLYYGFFSLFLLHVVVEEKLRGITLSLALVGLAGLLIYLLLTFSRGAWFSTAAGGLVLLLLSPAPRARQLLLIGVLMLVAMVICFWPEIQNEWRIGTSRRDLIWLNWLERLPEFWMFGEGPGQDLVYRYPWGDKVLHAHSLYLQLWYEYGIAGFALFLSLLATLLIKAWKARTDAGARIALSLLIFAMVAMVSDVYAVFHRPSAYWVILWLPAGLIVGLKRPARDESST
jgi:putative inorganic carbon (HCO3(-)) transporter